MIVPSALRRRAALLATAMLVAGGCSLGERADWADAIHDADEVASAASTAKVKIFVEMEGIDIVSLNDPEALFASMGGVVDFSSRTAATTVQSPKPRKGTVLYFDDTELYMPRSEASEGDQPWSRYDFEDEPSEDISVSDIRLSIGLPALSPVLAVEIFEGMLTGSIEREASEVVGSETSTIAGTFVGKVSPDQATRDIESEERREGILRVLETLGVNDDLIEGSITLDTQGQPERVKLRLQQRQDRRNLFGMTLTYEFTDWGTEADIEIPPSEDSVTQDLFRDFVLDYLRESV